MTPTTSTDDVRPLRARDRREEIMRLAAETGLANVEDVAARFGVTASTIRRDLAQLSGSGRLARTYGGAIPTAPSVENSLIDRGFEAYAAKAAIAEFAATRIGHRDVVLLDAGSTCALVARNLAVGDELTVATASLPVLNYVSGRNDVVVHSLGGRLRPLSDAFVGPVTEANLERMRFDVTFLGADGVLPSGELVEAEPEQTRLKELMARRSSAVYVLAHAAKLGARPFRFSARLEGAWTLVTDSDAPAEILDEFRANGIEVLVAPQREGS